MSGIRDPGIKAGALVKATAADRMLQEISEGRIILRHQRRNRMLKLGISLGMKIRASIGVGESAEPLFY
jgi:hypothetical protein